MWHAYSFIRLSWGWFLALHFSAVLESNSSLCHINGHMSFVFSYVPCSRSRTKRLHVLKPLFFWRLRSPLHVSYTDHGYVVLALVHLPLVMATGRPLCLGSHGSGGHVCPRKILSRYCGGGGGKIHVLKASPKVRECC